ncbi:MAG TPA: DNA-binding domain-containing protein [Steroidobacteraceae bacterium]|nr:DNA-binding domain-containing protein [Steroidobacteraceae bacterium]
MPSLRELQSAVLDALFAASPKGAIPLIAAPGGQTLARLRVYQTNLHSNFEAALRSSFPATQRLVGADYFRQTAREFQRRHPSRSGDLLHIGKFFPAYLAELHEHDEFGYLADVARLEWLVQDTLLAADHAPLDLQALSRLAPTAYDTLRFELHPALRLFESRYPILRIWEANVGSDAEPEMIQLHGAGDRLAVMRRRLQLEFHRSSAGEHGFLNSLSRGESFTAAVECGGACDHQFDATAALQRFVAAEAVVGFRLL